MLIESKALKEGLFEIKQQLSRILDRPVKPKVRFIIENRISIIDDIFIWLNKCEKEGAMKMEDLKLGELTQWTQEPREDTVDSKIIEDAKKLKKNFDAIKITDTKMKWTTFSNRTYALREEKKIPMNILPRKDKSGVPHLVYFENPPAPRKRRN